MEAPAGRQYDHLPSDVIREIALKLSLEDVLNNCKTSRKFNEVICNNEVFWGLKVKREFPNAKPIDGRWKTTYMKLTPAKFTGTIYYPLIKDYFFATFPSVRPFLVEVNDEIGRVKVFVRNTNKGIAQNDKLGIQINNDGLPEDFQIIKPDGELYNEKLLQFDNVVWIFPGNAYYLDEDGSKNYDSSISYDVNENTDGNSLLIDLSDNKYVYIGAKIFSFTSYGKITEFRAPMGEDPYEVLSYAFDELGNVYIFNSDVKTFHRARKSQLPFVFEPNPSLDRYLEDPTTPYDMVFDDVGETYVLKLLDYKSIASGYLIQKEIKAKMQQ